MKSAKHAMFVSMIIITAALKAQDTTFIFDPAHPEREQYLVEFTDQTVEEGFMVKGKKEGLVRTYYANGVLHKSQEFRNGKPHGWYMECEKNGIVLKEENYLDGKLEGEVRTYFTAKGIRIVKSVYHYKDGVFNGTCSDFNDMGNLVAFATYKKGIKDGVSRWYFSNGNLALEQHYVNGLLEGMQTMYYENGNVQSVGNYKDNMKTGNWTEYYEHGSVSASGEYVEDQKKGAWKTYFEDGSFSETEIY